MELVHLIDKSLIDLESIMYDKRMEIMFWYLKRKLGMYIVNYVKILLVEIIIASDNELINMWSRQKTSSYLICI